MLLFGLIPLALLAVYVVVQTRRRHRLRRFTEADVPQSLWRHVPIAVSLLSLFLLTVALATPTHDMRIPRNRACVVLMIDMSNSMRATDVEPNRLKAAEQAASQFASQLTPMKASKTMSQEPESMVFTTASPISGKTLRSSGIPAPRRPGWPRPGDRRFAG